MIDVVIFVIGAFVGNSLGLNFIIVGLLAVNIIACVMGLLGLPSLVSQIQQFSNSKKQDENISSIWGNDVAQASTVSASASYPKKDPYLLECDRKIAELFKGDINPYTNRGINTVQDFNNFEDLLSKELMHLF